MKKNYIEVMAISVLILFGVGALYWTQLQSEKLYEDSRAIALKIEHLDEVLTMSARMAAYTGDTRWIERYNDHVVLLDEVLKEAKKDPQILNQVMMVDNANNELVAMEFKAFDLVKQNRLKEAQTLLLSVKYENNKNRYSRGINNIISYLNYRKTQNTNQLAANYQNSLYIVIIMLVLLAIWGVHSVTHRTLQRHQQDLIDTTTKLDSIINIDQLTQLFNHRYCGDAIAEKVQLFQSNHLPVSVILFSIDRFKFINLHYGYDTGNSLLQQLSLVVKPNVAEDNTVCRWSGDELMIIVPNTHLTEAESLAERLCQAVASYDFGLSKPVTASFGVVELVSGMSVEKLINGAELALMQAQESGGNTVATFSNKA